MTVAQALSKWKEAATAEKHGERYTQTGNPRDIATELRHFAESGAAEISDPVEQSGRFTAAVLVTPRDERRNPFYLLVA